MLNNVIFTNRQQSQCGICDSNDPNYRHPITNVIERDTHSWWQSPALSESKQYEFVTIDMDLGQVSKEILKHSSDFRKFSKYLFRT